jgi:hypothetical protein
VLLLFAQWKMNYWWLVHLTWLKTCNELSICKSEVGWDILIAIQLSMGQTPHQYRRLRATAASSRWWHRNIFRRVPWLWLPYLSCLVILRSEISIGLTRRCTCQNNARFRASFRGTVSLGIYSALLFKNKSTRWFSCDVEYANLVSDLSTIPAGEN